MALYLHPPERAVVLCVDEKPQIQALERSQAVLPMRPGVPERRTHDYRRHGTTSLFAALDVATSKVLGRCFPRHRAVEFRRFLEDIAEAVPKDLDIHLVLDNYGTHKTAMIHRMVCRPAALPPALHADECIVDHPGGTVVRGDSGNSRFGAARTAAPRSWNRR